MKAFLTGLLAVAALAATAQKQKGNAGTSWQDGYERFKIPSRLPGRKLSLLHKGGRTVTAAYPVLFLHGSSFPSALAAAFRLSGQSWMDDAARHGFDAYALDFLGYGYSDRYPETAGLSNRGEPPGRASAVCRDVDRAVAWIRKRTGRKKVFLVGHSWGGVVAALYAARYPRQVAKLVLFAAVTVKQDTATEEAPRAAYEERTPAERIAAMEGLTPPGQHSRLEPEIFRTWGGAWLRASGARGDRVRFPAGYAADLYDLRHGKPVYDPAAIRVPVLLVRGEWDDDPGDADEKALLTALRNAPDKKYVVVAKGTHVLLLEKSRLRLYAETRRFLQNKSR